MMYVAVCMTVPCIRLLRNDDDDDGLGCNGRLRLEMETQSVFIAEVCTTLTHPSRPRGSRSWLSMAHRIFRESLVETDKMPVLVLLIPAQQPPTNWWDNPPLSLALSGMSYVRKTRFWQMLCRLFTADDADDDIPTAEETERESRPVDCSVDGVTR